MPTLRSSPTACFPTRPSSSPPSARWLLLLLAPLALALTGCLGIEAPRPRATPAEGQPQFPADKAATESAKPKPPGNSVHLVFTFGSEKKHWVKDLTDEFNKQRVRTAAGQTIFVEAIPMGSGECMDEVLNATRQTHIVSPASAAFISLANAKWRAKTNEDIVGSTRELVLSPVVIAMWKPMAEALGWPDKPLGWSDILALSQDPKGWAAKGYPQWGPFRFGHTHPEFSNSGLISVLAEYYAATGKKSGLTVEDIEDPDVGAFVSGVEKSVVHYGRSTGFFGTKMFTNGPGYLSAAVLYESLVVESYDHKPATTFPVVAIYPKEGTFWSDHPAAVVNRDWVTEAHREAAGKYLDFLLAKPQQERAARYGFRPASLDVPVTSPIDAAHGVDPEQPTNVLEVPPAPVMDAILKAWRKHKKHSNIVLALDVSGSMKHANKMDNAKQGALALLETLSDEDTFTLIPFNHEPLVGGKTVRLAEGREQAKQTIMGLFPDGGTALYDTTKVAYDKLVALREKYPDRIDAVVVLTDGADQHSKAVLRDVVRHVTYDNELKTIRVFTIGYGEGARAKELKQISDASQAKYYEGDPRNIRKVFRDISTFF